MRDVHKVIKEYNLGKKRKILTVFDGMIADTIKNKLNLIVSELFIRGRKLKDFLCFYYTIIF